MNLSLEAQMSRSSIVAVTKRTVAPAQNRKGVIKPHRLMAWTTGYERVSCFQEFCFSAVVPARYTVPPPKFRGIWQKVDIDRTLPLLYRLYSRLGRFEA